MSDRIYYYPNSDVLRNKLHITELDKLHEAEKKLTMLRISSLIDRPIKGAFDFLHLQEIHKYIFQDIYLWAGQLRKVNIAKGTIFCKVQFLEN